ncbi:DUF427-domain-containing protein [Cylindrobasidium torrendii FP15055 ss-10]|uniref:DUF427-domain-containing protein n=1 Tax=Cylindrobasidium torrendii FP15055 ss-10 TaxID=1314674 RepID=A0A0D7BRQ9_9AGAR|nr:DUF427-domain-containing protein [Cylindrobasidium torrendii FP15055 ss-10]
MFGPGIRIEKVFPRVRALFGGQFIVDSSQARFVWAPESLIPEYHFRIDELPSKYLSNEIKSAEYTTYTIQVREAKTKENALKVYHTGPLQGLFTIEFKAVDAWFEEDEQVFSHPKDPYHRVDVLHSSRDICIKVDGVEIARTSRPLLVLETNLIPRFYVPLADCHLDLLTPSDLKTGCPYKGEANYFHIQATTSAPLRENLAWFYRAPNLECASIRGYVCFYDEHLDVWLDGVKQPRPASFVSIPVNEGR